MSSPNKHNPEHRPKPAHILDGWCSRRRWRRIEARALAAHQRDQLTALRRLAATAEVIIDLDTEQTSTLGLMWLLLPHWTLTLAGVAPAVRSRVPAKVSGMPPTLPGIPDVHCPESAGDRDDLPTVVCVLVTHLTGPGRAAIRQSSPATGSALHTPSL